MRAFFLAVCVSVVLWLMLLTPAHADSPETHNRLVVSPQGPFTTIQAALTAAHAGDHIVVRAGVYRGPIVVTRSVTLEGENFPIIDNGGDGTVVTLAAPDVVFRGFELRGSGEEYDRDHSGVAVTAPRVIVENNRMREVLFGIFVAKASDVIVRGNDITSKADFDPGRKGDAIRIWYSPHAIIEQNRIFNSRDVVVWYSSGAIVRDNVIEGSRYGVHLMYCEDALIERNRILDNSVGIYTMNSHGAIIRDNLIRGQRGPSGYALGFKDVDNVEVARNVLIDNRGGAFLDGTPFTPQSYARFHDNIFAFNDVAVIMMPAVRGATIENNSFWENVEQVAISGGGLLGKSVWRGNFWSDYTGFDANNDGAGDLAYQAERFFDGMIDREPYLRMLLYSPAAQAIEFAGAAFPIVRPEPKFTDASPRIEPTAIPEFATPSRAGASGMFIASIAILLIGACAGALGLKKS